MSHAPAVPESPRSRAAVQFFCRHDGVLRMADALRAGIHRRTLYQLRDAGVIEPLSRGLYRLTDAPPLGHPDLVTVALRVPKGVVCLISALAFHDLTTQVPHEVWLAVPRESEPPRIDDPPVRVFWFRPAPFAAGVETHRLDGIPVRIPAARRPWPTASSTATRSAWTPCSKQSAGTGSRGGST